MADKEKHKHHIQEEEEFAAGQSRQGTRPDVQGEDPGLSGYDREDATGGVMRQGSNPEGGMGQHSGLSYERRGEEGGMDDDGERKRQREREREGTERGERSDRKD